MNNIQNYGMSNYSLGFKARVLDNPRALDAVKKEINWHKHHVQGYSESLKNTRDKYSQKCINTIIDAYRNALHKVIIKAKLLKKGYNPDEILSASKRKELEKTGFSSREILQITEREQLKTLAKSGDKAAFRELVKKEAEQRLYFLQKELNAGKITDTEFAKYKQMAMEEAKEEVTHYIQNPNFCTHA